MGVRQTFGLFLQPVSFDLELTRESFGLAIAIQNLVWGLAQPVAGAIADRYGSGRMLVVGGLLYAGGLLMATAAGGAWDLHLGLGMLVGLGLSGTTFAVVLGAVGRAVPEAQRSSALGLVSAAGSLGMFVMIPGAQHLLSGLGWIATLQIAAFALLTVPVLAGLLAERREVARRQDGDSTPLSEHLHRAGLHSGYWLLNLGFFVCGFHVTFVATHFPAYLVDHGIEPGVSAMALALIGFFNVLGTYGCGLLGARYRKKFLLSGLYAARALVMLMFLLVPVSPVSALVFAAMMGLLWLGTVPLTSGLVAQIFGVRYLSTLFGVVFLSHQLGSFLGAWLGGYVFDLTGSYDVVWFLAVLLGVLATLLHWPIKDRPLPSRPTQALHGRA